MANECIPLYRPGSNVTCLTTAPVVGKTFVDISAAQDGTELLFKVATATAGVKAFGVAASDAASGARVGVITSTAGNILPITADGAITAGALVEVGTGGKAKTVGTGQVVGKALTTGVNNTDCWIQLL